MSYYACMSIYIPAVRELVSQLLESNTVMTMNQTGDGSSSSSGDKPCSSGGQPCSSGGVGNPPASGSSTPDYDFTPPGQAGKTNGFIEVYDPNNQNYKYDPNGVNQPLIGNIGKSLEYQYEIHNLRSLTRFVFTDAQEQYILAFLKDKHREVYDKITGDPSKVHTVR